MDTQEKLAKAADEIPSRLPAPVYNLVRMLFDVEQMRKMMRDYDLDMEKMPLGKLSRRQIRDALTVLAEITHFIRAGASRSRYIGASNKFYTLIPHNFGQRAPPVITTVDVVTQKTEMLQNLLELEVAYAMLNQTEANPEQSNPFDSHYTQLNTHIDVVDAGSAEYAQLEEYVRRTHAESHRNYELEILDIFRVARQGERRRYETFSEMSNRKLLWHGSRSPNFVGILSHGLRIAPPEAPPSGYMFNKGIYFADMVSKSANYCFQSPPLVDTAGLVLLCEVALGESLEMTRADHNIRLPKDRHSVKGLGKTYPNPEESAYTADGVEIPMGMPIHDLSVSSALLYNEYIVYDEGQVNIKYLFKMNFKRSA